MMPVDAYRCYLSLKNHFTKEKYDYHKYCGKSRASVETFYKRKDRFWFEKVVRNKSDKEVIDFFVANFVSCNDPQTLWIGEIMKEGEGRYLSWKKRVQSLSYVFKEEIRELFSSHKVDDVFQCSKGHPIILKKYLSGNLSLETLVICDKIFHYTKDFDKKLTDPVWESVSMKVKKYNSFLNIDVFCYRKMLKEIIFEEK